jgi:saccharopine dehydrogenase (NAD+, L-lysine-forming)
MKILVLGGAGAMAKVAVRDLLDNRAIDRVGIADLKLERVREVAESLGDDRLEPIEADANDPGSLANAFRGWDVVINSTWYELNLKVMGSAIREGLHYLDLGGLYHMTLKQLTMDGRAKDAGVSCVLGLGSSPGVTNLMASLGARRLSKVSSVRIRVGGTTTGPARGGFNPPYSLRTIIDEACLPAVVLRRGKIETVPGMSEGVDFILPEPVGRVRGYLTLHSELATLPQSIAKEVQEMDFVVAFSPEFTGALDLLVNLGLAGKETVETSGGRMAPYDLLVHLADSLPKTKSTSADHGVRRVELDGEQDGDLTHLVFDCVSGPHERWGIGGRALGTGVPASLGAQWLARGAVKERGVLPPEACIDPMTFLRELSENGRGVMTFEDDGTSRHQL